MAVLQFDIDRLSLDQKPFLFIDRYDEVNIRSPYGVLAGNLCVFIVTEDVRENVRDDGDRIRLANVTFLSGLSDALIFSQLCRNTRRNLCGYGHGDLPLEEGSFRNHDARERGSVLNGEKRPYLR